jgi:hypothetical protein
MSINYIYLYKTKDNLIFQLEEDADGYIDFSVEVKIGEEWALLADKT